MVIKRLLLVLLGTMVLVGCGNQVDDENDQSDETAQIITEVSLEEVLRSPNVLPIKQENRLMLLNTDEGTEVELFKFGFDELPARSDLFDLQLSPNKKWLLWYTPVKGLTGYNLADKTTKVLEPASDWLNKNPYFEFGELAETVYYVTDDGTVLNQINLANGSKRRILIPYPFGNVFRISPLEDRVLFVAGFAQSSNKPEYMYTDIDGNSPVRFLAEAEIPDRFLVEWMSDGSGVLIAEGQNAFLYPYSDPERPVRYLSLPDEEKGKITQLTRIGTQTYIEDSAGYWHVYDAMGAEVARTPVEIASELRRPRFYPWGERGFLISELAGAGEVRYLRLWKSDFRGNKQLVIPRYGETVVVTNDLNLD